jgi:hypothetical protein
VSRLGAMTTDEVFAFMNALDAHSEDGFLRPCRNALTNYPGGRRNNGDFRGICLLLIVTGKRVASTAVGLRSIGAALASSPLMQLLKRYAHAFGSWASLGQSSCERYVPGISGSVNSVAPGLAA